MNTTLVTSPAIVTPASPEQSTCSLLAGVTQFLQLADGRIAYDDTGGDGPLVIALPGMGDLRQQYRYLRPYLTGAGFRLVTMDVRGQGESSMRWDDYSAQAAGQDVLALMAHLGAGSAIVIGNSFAAGAAFWAARQAPQHIRGAVLIGPIVRDLPISPLTKFALKAAFAGPWRGWFWMTYWNSLFATRKPADHAQYHDLLNKNLHESGRFDALKTMVGLSKAETDALMDGIKLPSLVVMGTKDADFPNPEQEACLLASRLGAEMLLVEGAGHYPHVEMPECTGPGVVKFLKQLLG
ncbi:alpha/beta fold hydrolase [Noviherbaspirillum aerium]|uniref:alpha/beta fold hydrolase n=1 Tax=Noviherbaspirillum aerium TaxID=2588497 RepID=UPI00124E33DD|nr:alpha/beta hydrolase [Noviherbaspirillum aerium]